MRIEDYPPQEPFSPIGEVYHVEVMRRMPADLVATDLSYGPDPYQGVAVYPAAEPRGDVLCLIHGGGWTNGYKEWMAFMAPALTARGITAASFGYRLAPQHVWPSCFEDVADALALVHARVADFGGDPGRIFVAGHSAGGHLASLLALRTDWQAPRGLPADVVKGAMPISGTFLFGPESGLSMRPRFLGDPMLANEAPASPMSHLHAGAPPFLVAWGDADFPHLRRQAGEFADALAALSVPVRRLELPGCDHAGASYAGGEADGAWIEAAVSLMRPSRRES